jgi:FG-GAP-like repeat
MRRTVPVAIVMVAALVVAAVSGLAWAATTMMFASPVKYAVGKSAVDVISADFDDDGYPDLAVSKVGSSSISVLLGIGNGTFEAAKNYAAGDNPRGITAADFNGDSDLDLAVGNSETNKVTILLGSGDGTFGAARSFDGGG